MTTNPKANTPANTKTDHACSGVDLPATDMAGDPMADLFAVSVDELDTVQLTELLTEASARMQHRYRLWTGDVRLALPVTYCPGCRRQLVNHLFVDFTKVGGELLCMFCAQKAAAGTVAALRAEDTELVAGARSLSRTGAVRLLMRHGAKAVPPEAPGGEYGDGIDLADNHDDTHTDPIDPAGTYFIEEE